MRFLVVVAMKAYYALCGAIIGAGVAMLIRMSFPSILLGLAMGVFAGFIVSGVVGMRATALQRSFQKMGTLRGRTLAEITREAGAYTKVNRCVITDRDNASGFYYTWTEGKYSIVLLFDADNVCIGVTKEINPHK